MKGIPARSDNYKEFASFNYKEFASFIFENDNDNSSLKFA
jgi:hypothetical protein